MPVDRQGLVDPAAVKKALERGTTLVSIMHSNNEVGTLQPIKEIAQLARARGALMHTDAAQSLQLIERGQDLIVRNHAAADNGDLRFVCRHDPIRRRRYEPPALPRRLLRAR